MALIDWKYTLNFWKGVLGLGKKIASPSTLVQPPPPPPAPSPEPQPESVAPSSTWTIFEPGLIIADEEFTDSNSMSAEEIEAFLVRKGGVILTGTEIDGHLVSYWLSKHCQDLGLNPKILLTHLQKEMGAITRTTPYKKQHSYDYIMGVGAYDGKWSEKWKGIDKQILGAATTCIKWYNKGKENNTYPMNHKVGDNKELIIKNSATYSLYKYTPWVGNEDKKIPTNKGFHVYKAPFGNFLFWKVYRGFFGKK